MSKLPGEFELIERYMAPLYDPATQSPSDAKVCVDMFEYPNVPLAYPVTWITAREAKSAAWVNLVDMQTSPLA